jgi:glyoxalase family protein
VTPSLLRLHHVTATVAEATPDVRFYTRTLGLRLVKKTVNFDNHGVYHFYYGDEKGTPSSLMTTFPYAGQGVEPGVKGAGQITVTSFSVPPGSLAFWRNRLSARGVEWSEAGERFGASSLMVQDPSGLHIELLEGEGDERTPWVSDGIDSDAAIRGIHGVTLTARDAGPSVEFLTDALGLEVTGQSGSRTRVATELDGPGGYLEILESPDAPDAVNGLGTVHHVALAVRDEEAQLAMRERLVGLGCQVTPVRDRQYFRSIYFREPAGVLYEIATEGPGFTLDEDLSRLGTELKLPAWEEENRATIEAALPPIEGSPSREDTAR